MKSPKSKQKYYCIRRVPTTYPSTTTMASGATTDFWPVVQKQRPVVQQQISIMDSRTTIMTSSTISLASGTTSLSSRGTTMATKRSIIDATTSGTTTFDTTTSISYGGYEYDDHEMFAEKCCMANKDQIRLGLVSDRKFQYESS